MFFAAAHDRVGSGQSFEFPTERAMFDVKRIYSAIQFQLVWDRHYGHRGLMLACWLGLLLSPTVGIAAAELSSFKAAHETGARRQVTAVVQAEGDLLLNADGRGVQKAAMKLSGKLEFQEIILGTDERGRVAQSSREYSQANGQLQVRKWQSSLKLNDTRTTIIASADAQNRLLLVSPSGPLSQSDLDTISLQVDPLALDRLLPTEQQISLAGSQTTGTESPNSWRVTNSAAALLLGLEVVHRSTLECRVIRWSSEAAVFLLEINGEVEGAISGASSEITIKGKLNFDPSAHQFTWADLNIVENRSIGHAAPGLKSEARIRVRIVPQAAVDSERWAVLREELTATGESVNQLLAFGSQFHGFEMIHDRNWKLLIDGPTTTVFRLIKDGDLIAQANFSAVRTSERPDLNEFKQQIQHKLGDNLQSFISAEEEQSSTRTRIFRVVATGVVNELPIQWVYYYFRDRANRAVSCTITMDARLVERFVDSGDKLLGSLRLTDILDSSKSQPANSHAQAPRDDEKR